MKYFFFFSILLLAACSAPMVNSNSKSMECLPPIFPDYQGVTVPVNIAPLDFSVEECNVSSLDVELSADDSVLLRDQWNGNSTCWDIADWHSTLKKAVGKALDVLVHVSDSEGNWRSYKKFSFFVSPDSIDQYLSYRRIAPAYETFSAVGIYQRDITSFDEFTVTDCNELQYSCMNCHATRMGNCNDLVLHVRGQRGGTIIRKNGHQRNYNTKTDYNINAFAYAYWHPDGRYIAFSTNTTRQLFHAGASDRIDVFDGASDVQIFDTETDSILVAPNIHTRHFENFPAFSPCGKWLYYVHADSLPVPELQDSLRYVLCRVAFDAKNAKVDSHVDTLADMRNMGLSLSVPRPSPDGKFIMLSSLRYGNFPVWHPASDLWMYSVKQDSLYCLNNANSPYAEAYHNWSTNSRWAVVASRRTDGLHTRLCLFHIDEQGNASKAFLLPQRNPRLTEDHDLRSYNCPEFEINRMSFDKGELMHFYDNPTQRDHVY